MFDTVKQKNMAAAKESKLAEEQKEAQEKHRRTVTLEEICRKESTLTGPRSTAAAAALNLRQSDMYIKESKKVHKDKFVADFDEDEVPDLV